MFVRHYVDIHVPFEKAEPFLVNDPASWLPGVASETDQEGVHLLAQVGFGVGLRVRKRVEVTVREPLRAARRTVIPIRWSTGADHSPLPVMEGDLEIAPFGPDGCHLAMSGRYSPPFGSIGEALDRALLHRVAEATVRDFVRRVAAVVEAGISRRDHPSFVGTGRGGLSP
jgi:hypothetical protein